MVCARLRGFYSVEQAHETLILLVKNKAIGYNISYKTSRGVRNIITTSEKLEIILSRHDKTKKWLAEQWGIKQPSISQKFKDDNWKESDIQKFCEIMNIEYEIVFTDGNETI